MKPRICICCGEPNAESAHTLPRNPNMCVFCSSLLNGMEDQSNIAESGETIEPRPPEFIGVTEADPERLPEEKTVIWSA